MGITHTQRSHPNYPYVAGNRRATYSNTARRICSLRLPPSMRASPSKMSRVLGSNFTEIADSRTGRFSLFFALVTGNTLLRKTYPSAHKIHLNACTTRLSALCGKYGEGITFTNFPCDRTLQISPKIATALTLSQIQPIDYNKSIVSYSLV